MRPQSWIVALALAVAARAAALEAVPEAVLRQNRAAVERIGRGAAVRAVWIQGKFGEYGDPVHVVRFGRDGAPVEVGGKFIRLGDSVFRFVPVGTDWRVLGKFGDGGGSEFRVVRSPQGRILEVRGRFYHYGSERFRFVYDRRGRLVRIEGRFGRGGTPGFSFLRDAEGRISEVVGKFLRFGSERLRIRYYPGTRLVREVTGKFGRWGDERFAFYYEAW